jgi:protein involved in polysaccharide export with SLBB domain
MKFRLITITLAVTLSLLAANIHSPNAQDPAPDRKLIYVFGEVQRPGVYQVTLDMTLKQLIGVASGMTDEAGRRFSVILREQPSGAGQRMRVEMITVDWNELVKGTTPEIPLKNIDFVIVPRCNQ